MGLFHGIFVHFYRLLSNVRIKNEKSKWQNSKFQNKEVCIPRSSIHPWLGWTTESW